MANLNPTPAEFQSYTANIYYGSPEDCWQWTGKTNSNNASHPVTDDQGRQAPRGIKAIAYYLSTFEDPTDKRLRHVCENDLCCNPDHIVEVAWGEPLPEFKVLRKKLKARDKKQAKSRGARVKAAEEEKKAKDAERTREAERIKAKAAAIIEAARAGKKEASSKPARPDYGSSKLVPTAADTEEFYGKVEVTDTCHLWKGITKSGSNFGLARICRKDGERCHIAAQRFAYLLKHGKLDPRRRIVQTCGNPLCVNPEHLEEVSHFEQKRVLRKRQKQSPRNAKLNPAQILEIRRRYDAEEKQRDIAADYGISPSQIGYIGKRKSWGHVPEVVNSNTPTLIISNSETGEENDSLTNHNSVSNGHSGGTDVPPVSSIPIGNGGGERQPDRPAMKLRSLWGHIYGFISAPFTS